MQSVCGSFNVIDIKKAVEYFQKESIFCFTSDIDWAPEWAIEFMIGIFKRAKIPLTLFVTHPSECIQKEYKNKPEHVGLHPNFLPGSTQGNSYSEIIDYCTQLWPDAISYRCHSAFDNTIIAQAFNKRGFKYESNSFLYLQPYCAPMQHRSELIRFPIWWEDDVHAKWGLPFELNDIIPDLRIPGLKIFNFHPFNLTMNTPSKEFYEKHKRLRTEVFTPSKYLYNYNQTREIKGELQFLFELLLYLKKRNIKIMYLDEVYTYVKHGTL